MDSDRNYGFQSILSQDSAIGLIMALGNLGSNLQVCSQRGGEGGIINKSDDKMSKTSRASRGRY